MSGHGVSAYLSNLARMKRLRHFAWIIVGVTLASCADKQAAADKARDEAEANARAEAAKKEMNRLPETFKPRYNKKREPTEEKAGDAAKETPPPAASSP